VPVTSYARLHLLAAAVAVVLGLGCGLLVASGAPALLPAVFVVALAAMLSWALPGLSFVSGLLAGVPLVVAAAIGASAGDVAVSAGGLVVAAVAGLVAALVRLRATPQAALPAVALNRTTLRRTPVAAGTGMAQNCAGCPVAGSCLTPEELCET
jgi:hypothetical protein